MPDTKPDLTFGDGVCAACWAYERRADIDWDMRRQEFLVTVAALRTHPVYDCVVPASGGKDSHWQVLQMLELGLRPLVVTATTDHLTEIGRCNIENLKHQGVDYIEVTPNPVVRRKLNRIALTEVGDISWPEHVAIFSIPVRIAQNYGIPLVVWGENPQNEYGGPPSSQNVITLNRAWREEFGGLLGLRVADLIGYEGLSERDLWTYEWPPDSSAPVRGVWLGQFFAWDGWRNALIAQAHGFETYPHAVEGSIVNYENLDNAQTGIHDYFKWLKFGFGRASDIASLHVRRGRLTRVEAIMLVNRLDGLLPESYLGVPLDLILQEIGITRAEFDDIVDRFANRSLLHKLQGRWKLREPVR